MTGAGLQKSFTDENGLHAHPFFKHTGLRADLAAGEVFPAIRKDEVHFYCGGARLFKYQGKRVYTNRRYLGIQEGASRDVSIPEDRFNLTGYEALKRTCKEWRHQESELSVVSRLFPDFSIAASDLPTDGARLFDIECRFPRGAGPADAEPQKAQEMIDCLFLTSKGTLVFVEVKRAANDEARGSGQNEPAVAGQLRRYRRRLESEALRENIRKIYADVTPTLGRIVGRELQVPQTVFKSVPLLIVGPKSLSSPHAKDVWQRDLLASPKSLDSEIIGIDGRNGNMKAALDDFLHAVDANRVETGT